MYSLSVILEADMRPGEFLGMATERNAHLKAEEHMKEKETSVALRVMLTHTLLRSEVSSMEGMSFICKQAVAHTVQKVS